MKTNKMIHSSDVKTASDVSKYATGEYREFCWPDSDGRCGRHTAKEFGECYSLTIKVLCAEIEALKKRKE